jgi:hypothetical protein
MSSRRWRLRAFPAKTGEHLEFTVDVASSNAAVEERANKADVLDVEVTKKHCSLKDEDVPGIYLCQYSWGSEKKWVLWKRQSMYVLDDILADKDASCFGLHNP